MRNPDETKMIEEYTLERVAEFQLGSAIDQISYEEAVEEVRRMGLDPLEIDHFKPSGVE